MIVEIVLIFIMLIIALGVGFLLHVFLEFKKTAAQATIFLAQTEKQLNSTLLEIEQTLKSLRSVTDNVTGVTEDVHSISHAVTGVASDLRKTTHNIKSLTKNTAGSISAMRIALNTAIQVLINNFKFR